MQNVFDGLVCFAIGLLKLGGGFVLGGRWGIEQAVGERAADAFVKENKQECCFVAFGCEAICVTFAVALDEPVCFHLPKVIAQLSEGVAFRF